MGNGTYKYYNNLGDTARLAVLSFSPPLQPGLQWVEVYKRSSDWSSDTLVERQALSDRANGIYPYWYMLQASEANMTYSIDFLDESNQPYYNHASARLVAEQYIPPVVAPNQPVFNPIAHTTELVRRHYLVLEAHGQLAILLQTKTSGQVCACRADESRHALYSCSTCYGTGFEGGYDVFHPFLFKFQPAGEQLKLTETGIGLEQQPRAWTAISPEVHDGDIIIRLNDRLYDRYKINSPTRSWPDGAGGVPTIQEFAVKTLKEDEASYKFPVENYVSAYTKPTTQPGLPERGV